MKIVSCEVIQDLIPLYVEDMLSEESKMLVESHLNECEECREYMNELQTTSILPPDTDTRPLEKIQKNLQKKKWLTIVFSALVTLLIGSLIVIFMTAPEYLPYSEDVVAISETEEGFVLADFNEDVAGYKFDSYPTEDGTGKIYHLTAWGTTWQDLTNAEGVTPVVLNPNGERVASVYYYLTDGTADELIYGEEQHPSGGVVTLPRLSLAYLTGIVILALIVCLVIMWLVRSNRFQLEQMARIILMPISYLLAQFMVMGLGTTTYSFVRDLSAILLVAILLYGVLTIGLKGFKNYLFSKEQ